MGKRRYAGTTLKGAEPRVRFNIPRHDNGRVVKERAMGGFIVDENGEEIPTVMNRLVFQCEHGQAGPHWQGVVGIGDNWRGSVQVRCDVCRFTARVNRAALAGLWILCGDRDFVLQHQGLLGMGFHDGRPGAAYAVVQLKAAEPLAKVWRERLAEDDDAEDD